VGVVWPSLVAAYGIIRVVYLLIIVKLLLSMVEKLAKHTTISPYFIMDNLAFLFVANAFSYNW